MGEGQRERETQKVNQAPDSELSAQSSTWDLTHELKDHDLSWSRMLNWLSHTGPLSTFFSISTTPPVVHSNYTYSWPLELIAQFMAAFIFLSCLLAFLFSCFLSLLCLCLPCSIFPLILEYMKPLSNSCFNVLVY